jgi:homoserine dehydrogenase
VPASRHSIGIGLLGLGVVGSGVARILDEKAAVYASRVGVPLVIRRVLVRDIEKERAFAPDRSLLTTDPEAVFGDPEIDVIVEVMGGEHPAYAYIQRAVETGRYVVTANKEVMAKHGPDLLGLAQQKGVDILYEASVGGGIPVISPLKRDLLANSVSAIAAIINGTTNYILTRMARDGMGYSEALRQAQDLGYAESDPTNDVEGFDAAYKLAILASLGFHTLVHPDQVYREGITAITDRDFRYAGELGYVIKLLALARREPDGLRIRVHPALVHDEEPIAKVDGVFNAIQLEGDLLGRVLFQGRGAGSLPTTSAVVADLIDVAIGLVRGWRDRLNWVREGQATVAPMESLRTRYYMRLTLADQPGVLARIASVLGDHSISLASVIQKEADESAQTAEIVIMTHVATEAGLSKALAELRTLEAVVGVGNCIRVETTV